MYFTVERQILKTRGIICHLTGNTENAADIAENGSDHIHYSGNASAVTDESMPMSKTSIDWSYHNEMHKTVTGANRNSMTRRMQ